MLCEKCGKNKAVAFYKQTVNGVTSTINLCGECAEGLNFDNMFSTFELDDLFSSFLGGVIKPQVITDKKLCDKCHSSFNDIAATGRMGCDMCYETFREEIMPSIEKIHGKVNHTGDSVAITDESLDEISKLKQELEQAVNNQEFELAAQIRDKIKNLENQGGE